MKSEKDIVQIGDLSFKKYVPASDIEDKVQEIADAIREDFHEKYPREKISKMCH